MNKRSRHYLNFAKFYNENKKRIHMPKDENYPINYKLGRQWAESQCDPESRDFADGILRFTEYVSFKKFSEQLKKVCLSYVNTYSAPEHKDTVFILIVPFKVKKSNIWVSLQAFAYLKGIINDIYYDITEVYNHTKEPNSPLYNKKVRCLICDDCAYTGHQLSFISSFDPAWLKFSGKLPAPSVNSRKWIEWYDDMNSSAEHYIQNISINQFSVDLIIPYMSILAQAKLRSVHYIKIPKECIVFPIFSQQVNIDRVPPHILSEFKQTFQYHKDISAIYFDHKIADSVSTFHKIYLLAPLFNCVIKNRSIGFIENCRRDKIPDNIKIWDCYIDIEKKLEEPCPPTFYKALKYTFNGKIVDPETYVFELFGTKNIHVKKENI